MKSIYLIVGLGNPGREYEHTRHNVGFDFVDAFAESIGTEIANKGFKGLYSKCKYKDKDLILLKPTTYMNNSGESIREIINFFKIDIENILVIYDDMDFKPGIIRIKENGSSAGHNGIKSIIQNLGTDKFKRIRIGIGKFQYDIVDYVLSKPNKEDREAIEFAIKNAIDATKLYLNETFNKAMSLYNKK